MTRAHLEEFVQAYKSGEINKRVESERFKKFTYEELLERDKTNLDIIWLKDDLIINPDDLPAPDVIAEEIIENLEAAMVEFEGLLASLRKEGP